MHGFGWCHILTPNQSPVAKLYEKKTLAPFFPAQIGVLKCAKKSKKIPRLLRRCPTTITTGGEKGGIVLGEDIREVQNSDMRSHQLGACGFYKKIRAKYSPQKLPPQEEGVNKALSKGNLVVSFGQLGFRWLDPTQLYGDCNTVSHYKNPYWFNQHNGMSTAE